MLLSLDSIGLLLYCVQQLGVMFAVGSESIILIAYLVSMRDGVINATEETFAKSVERVLVFGLGLIVLSGFGTIAFHYALDQIQILLEPAYLFKWFLIIGLLVAALVRRGRAFMHFSFEGLVGGMWFALFFVHIVAPVIPWFELTLLFFLWMGAFFIAWSTVVHVLKYKGRVAPAPVQKIIVEEKKPPVFVMPKPPPQPPPPKIIPAPILPPTPPPLPKPPPPPAPVLPPPRPIPTPPPTPKKTLTPRFITLPQPLVQSGTLPVPVVPHITADTKSAEQKVPYQEPGLPALRIMPQTVEDLARHNRPAVVQFKQPVTQASVPAHPPAPVAKKP